jgi:hypothetical protein
VRLGDWISRRSGWRAFDSSRNTPSVQSVKLVVQVKLPAADDLEMHSISASSPSLLTAQTGGLTAIATANQRLNDDAHQALVLAEAGANVIRAENKMLGALLDVFA